MDEIIIPNDGLVFKKPDGRPILQIKTEDDMSFLNLFSANNQSRLSLACGDELCGVLVQNGNKSVELTSGSTNNEIRFTNENLKVTHFFYTNEDGGQIGLADAAGNLMVSMGCDEDVGASIIINNKNGVGVAKVMNYYDKGYIELLDGNGKVLWKMPSS